MNKEMKIFSKVTFEIMSYEDFVGNLVWMITSNDGPVPLSQKTFEIYPFLFGKIGENMSDEEIRNILENEMLPTYKNEIQNMEKYRDKYQNVWNYFNDRYMLTMESYFKMEWPKECFEIKGFVGPKLPAFPRYIEEHTFHMSTETSDVWLMEITAHECCHFMFFEKWKVLFNNWSYNQFNNPDIIWYLSEMVVDPILNNEKFRNIFKHVFKAYDIFYDINIDDVPLMEAIKNIYNTNDIEKAIKDSYRYVLDNEQKIKNPTGFKIK